MRNTITEALPAPGKSVGSETSQTIFGGALAGQGDASSYAEFDFKTDPILRTSVSFGVLACLLAKTQKSVKFPLSGL
jgi:hypothetical protein